MKVILAIFCGLVVLFAGGCALMFLAGGVYGNGGEVPFALIPGSVAVLNLLVLLGMYGKKEPQIWAFYVLAGVDVLAAIVMAIFWVSVSSQISDIAILAIPVIAVLLLKAVLTVKVARKLPLQPPSA